MPESAKGRFIMMSSEMAFAAYESARPRLPAVGPGGAARHAQTIADIADAFDVILLDAFGVLNIGETAIPGAPDRVAALQAAGKRVMVVSNAAAVPHAALMAKYARLGYRFVPEDVITSRRTVLGALPAEPTRRWGVMGRKSPGRNDLAGLDLTYLAEDPAAYADAEGFLLLGSGTWTETRQELLEAALQDRPRTVWVANPDIVAPREGGFSPEPGHYAHRLADATGVAPQFFGKPFANIFDLAFAALPADTPRARVLMVGDTLHTDILGAQAVGIASALVAGYGFFAESDAEMAIRVSGIRPDFILSRP